MAKQRRNHTAKTAVTGLLNAIDLVAKAELGQLTEAEKIEANQAGLEAVKSATEVIKDSNIITSLEVTDDNIEALHQAEEQAALEANNIPPIIDAEPAEPAALPEPAENDEPPLEHIE